eukprot:4241761-Pleurochrysis_carterae.AAC.1
MYEIHHQAQGRERFKTKITRGASRCDEVHRAACPDILHIPGVFEEYLYPETRRGAADGCDGHGHGRAPAVCSSMRTTRRRRGMRAASVLKGVLKDTLLLPDVSTASELAPDKRVPWPWQTDFDQLGGDSSLDSGSTHCMAKFGIALAPSLRWALEDIPGIPVNANETSDTARDSADMHLTSKLDGGAAERRLSVALNVKRSFLLFERGTRHILHDGSEVWRLALRCETSCLWMSAGLRHVSPLPLNATFHAHGDGGVGGVGSLERSVVNGTLVIPPLPGSLLVIEYSAPAAAAHPTALEIETVTLGHSGFFGSREAVPQVRMRPAQSLRKVPRSATAIEIGSEAALHVGLSDGASILDSPLAAELGRSGACMVDVSCVPALADAARGVVALLFRGTLCTGSLLNAIAPHGAVAEAAETAASAAAAAAAAAGGRGGRESRGEQSLRGLAEGPLLLTAYHCLREHLEHAEQVDAMATATAEAKAATAAVVDDAAMREGTGTAEQVTAEQ